MHEREKMKMKYFQKILLMMMCVAMLANLVNEGHEVLVIDNDPATITELTNIYDVMCICGNGADSDVLKEAGVEDCEMFAAVTASDELNMLACFVAERMGAKHTIARIRNPEYNDKSLDFLSKQLKLTVSVNPEWMAAKELFNILKLPAAVNIESFSGGNLEMVELRLKQESILDGISLIDLRRKYKAQYLICAVQRGDEVYIPDGNFVLKSGDKIGITSSGSEIQKLFKMLGLVQKSAKSVMILGASRIAYYLAKRLINSGNRVIVIDMDERVCRSFAEELPDAVVIQGDGAEQELLLEEGLGSVDAFVALTGMDELNILISIFATSQNVPKVITKVNRNELAQMADKLGLDSIVSPKKTVSDVLARYARAINNSQSNNSIETLYKLMGGSVEAIEFNVSKDFKGIKTPLKDLRLKHNMLIAGIVRGRKAIIPCGMDEILPGDRVVVIVSGTQLLDLEDILE
jgi:trk system potassium uptake protein TrkA